MDLISVIVPVYNVEKYLCRCVQSIQNQTYKNLEIILVDDGSPDNCPQMCDEFKRKDSRIRVIHKKNEGLGLTRNAGLSIATGVYVTFIDSDDWISETHIENLHRALVEYSADLVFGNHTRVNASGEMIQKSLKLREGLYEENEVLNEILLPLYGTEPHSPNDIQINSSVAMNLYKMNVVRDYDIAFLSERYAVAEDLFFNLDFLNYTQRVVFVKEFGYYYFQNLNSICEKYNPKRFERTINYYTEICKRASDSGLEELVMHRIERSFLMKIRVAIRHIVLSDLDRKEKYHQIDEMLTHPIVQKVLHNYPIEMYVFSMRLLAKMMLKKRVKSVYFLMWTREGGRKGGLTRKLLRMIGIGK